MDPAENQQMVFLWQVVERSDDGVETFVSAEKPKDPDQLARRRHSVQDRKFSA
jgi:hypothetical protein